MAGTVSRSVLAALAAAGTVIASCGPASPNNAGLPTHKDLSGYPAALLEATLVRDGECLYAQSAGQSNRVLPIWPSGFSLTGNDVMDGGRKIASVGDSMKLGGGEYGDTQYDFLRTLMTDDVPVGCRGGNYWLVSSVVP